MRVHLIPCAVIVAAVSASDTSSNTGEIITCESFNLKSVQVIGAPNPFCLYDQPCQPNSVSVCPGADSYDVRGVLLTFGSCCAPLDAVGTFGCVSRELVGSTFQCVGATFPPLNTPPPASDSGSGSRDEPIPDPGTPSPTPIFPPKDSIKPTFKPTTTPTPSPTPEDSSSSSSSSSSDSEPDAGDEPAPTTAPPATPPASLTLEPIIETPSSTETNSPNSPVDSQSDASGDTSTGSSSFYDSLNSNMALMLVLGSVAALAVIIGAFALRRRSGSGRRSTKHSESTIPPLTPPYADDFFDDHMRPTTDAFSPIQVQSAHAYASTSTPGQDRPSYFL